MRPSGFSRFTPFMLSLPMLLLSAPSAQAVAPTSVISAKAADGAQIAQDIASAGRLRTQSQRLAKLYLQAAMGLAGRVRRGSRSIAGWRMSMPNSADCRAMARRPNMQRAYTRSETLWQEMRGLLKKSPDTATRERMNLVADELMVHTGKLAMLIEGEGETTVGRLLDLSSRLNMLSQRLARLYLQAYAGDRTQGVLTDIEQARKEFANGLLDLDTARENSTATGITSAWPGISGYSSRAPSAT